MTTFPAATARQRRQSATQFRGSLAVNSKPPGARILVDGVRLGETPLRIERIPAGSHVLRLEMDGYRPSASAVHVTANRRTRITVALDASTPR